MSSTLYLEGGLCVLLLLSVCICIFLVCFAVSLRYRALPGEEHENMFSVQKDSKSLRAGEKISCVRQTETVNVCHSGPDCTRSIHLCSIYGTLLIQKSYSE